jgi:citrate synthase
MAETEWVTAVGRVGTDGIRVRGYALEEIIEQLTFPEAIYLAIRGERPDRAQTRVLNAALCGILDHSLYAPAAIVARTVASTMPGNIMPAVGDAIGTMGPVAGSPQHAGELIASMVAQHEQTGDGANECARRCVEELLDAGRRMPGVGHALYPDGDPRATALLSILRGEGLIGFRTEAFLRARDEFAARKKRPLPLNIDGAMACALAEIGFAPIEMAGVAGISFLPGLIAHACEEMAAGPRLRVADANYVGAADRRLT